MHEFDCSYINKDEIFKISEKMLEDKRRLVIMNGYINDKGENVICYNFDINGNIVTYKIVNEKEIPSITNVYKESASWCEEEIEEMMNVKFIGLKRGGRLFLPEEFKNFEGQILVMPLDELKKYKEKVDK
ncbi:NADH-quinone oxidoreductase subunit C [Clostridium sp.]|uniref:NADH-quinone oxidoreductase subunit C n=1 Tax=Clostridium sp. TaxID=1506 RepID=UPI002FC6459F